MRNLLVIIYFFCSVFEANSQNLTVEGTAPNLYISHTVAPKENFYSIGRLYNQTPNAIASFNNIVMEKGLVIGQKIKIPVNGQNSGGTESAGSRETLAPITHVVAKGETLFKIGKDYNVTPEAIKEWNSLTSNNIVAGTPLVVGHLKSKEDRSTANTSVATTSTAAKTTVVAPGRELPQSKQPASEIKTEENVAASPATSTKAFTPIPPDVALNEPKKPVSEVKKEEPSSPVNSSEMGAQKDEVTSTAVTRPQEKVTDTPVKEQTIKVKPIEEAPVRDVAKETTSKPAEAGYSRNNESGSADVLMETGSLAGGAFAGIFSKSPSQKSLTIKTGEAATFKSTSGWQDKKYYVLMNDVSPGTILKISSSANKIVYAKVLGSMPEMKENNGLLLRISNSAASSLGIIDPKFPVEVSYHQ
ncbi:MAG: LysM peptidoglycan-binding protein [Segetibacter sp.]|nr:LysM peptidoglycan-binding protein [Segetibacter sp.]